MAVSLKFARLTSNATVPTKGSRLAAGHDLYSAHDSVVEPLGRTVVFTDLQIAVPEGHYARIAPRSGLAVKSFVHVGAGVVDRDYAGNVGVVLFNFGSEPFVVKKGDRVAQLILEKISEPVLEEVQRWPTTVTERGCAGLGGRR